MNNTTRVILLSLLSVAVLAGCKTKATKDNSPPVDNSGTTGTVIDNGATTAGAYGPDDLEKDSCLRQRVVYFDLDQYVVKPEYQAIINCHAKYLRDRPSSRLTLEGNTDERGTAEYNLALGQRRSEAVKNALSALGVNTSQIEAVSLGKEKPKAQGSNEAAWAENRRVDFVY